MGGRMLADRIFGASERRDPPRRKRQPVRAPKRRGGARSRARGRGRSSPEVLQRRLDLAGLAAIGTAVYLGYVIYLGWNGGTVGNGSETALSYAVGAGAVVVPVALGLAGIGLILRPFLPSPRSVAVGVVAIASGLLLALAAQTAGLGPDGVRKGLFDPDFFPHYGGGIGETLYWATTTLFQRLGAQIIAVLLLISGLLLVTGRSVSDMVRAGRRGFDRAKRGTLGFATAVKESRIRTDPDLIDTTPVETEPIFGPPEPVEGDSDDYQVLVGGGDDEQETERIANFDEAVRVADESDTDEIAVYEGEGEGEVDAEPAEPGGARDRAAAGGRPHPDGREARRASPSPRRSTTRRPIAEQVLERGKPDKGPGHQGPRGDRPDAARGARALRGRGADRGHGYRAPREPLRAQARARDQGLEDHPAQGRPRLRARLDRHPHPGADPGQAGGRSRGPEPAAPSGPARATSTAGARRAPRRWSLGSARTSPAAPSGPTCRRCRTP